MKQLPDRLLWQETDAHRNEGCSKYNECLDIAATAKMKSFSCISCPDYDPQVVLVEHYSDSETMPGIPERMNYKDFSREMLDKLREVGAPAKGRGIGNADWRKKDPMERRKAALQKDLA